MLFVRIRPRVGTRFFCNYYYYCDYFSIIIIFFSPLMKDNRFLSRLSIEEKYSFVADTTHTHTHIDEYMYFILYTHYTHNSHWRLGNSTRFVFFENNMRLLIFSSSLCLVVWTFTMRYNDPKDFANVRGFRPRRGVCFQCYPIYLFFFSFFNVLCQCASATPRRRVAVGENYERYTFCYPKRRASIPLALAVTVYAATAE